MDLESCTMHSEKRLVNLVHISNTETVAREVLARMSGKWTLLVLHVLAEYGKPVRYTQILRTIEGVTQKVLTQTLRTLERDGFIARRVYAQLDRARRSPLPGRDPNRVGTRALT